jgi:hypothetical protein
LLWACIIPSRLLRLGAALHVIISMQQWSIGWSPNLLITIIRHPAAARTDCPSAPLVTHRHQQSCQKHSSSTCLRAAIMDHCAWSDHGTCLHVFVSRHLLKLPSCAIFGTTALGPSHDDITCTQQQQQQHTYIAKKTPDNSIGCYSGKQSIWLPQMTTMMSCVLHS